MRHVAIFNNQAFGDCLLGTHTASLYKRVYPQTLITFLVRSTLRATTSESDIQNNELLQVLELQNGIDNVGVVLLDGSVQTKYPIEKPFDAVITQDRWFSDLGIVRSQSYQFTEPEFEDTETQFRVGAPKQLPTDRIVITTAGPLDWNRKLHSERTRQQTLFGIITFLKQNNIPAEIVPLGKDVDDYTILQALQRINSSHIYIGPMGVFVHAAAGLGVDTIHATSVYPPEYDSPKFYHSGWHQPIKSEIHCKTYACVNEKSVSTQVYPEGPTTKMGFWPKHCTLTETGKSCVNSITPESIVESFKQWYSERGKSCLNQ